MSRMSRDELAEDGSILNGYDYNVQVWVEEGFVQMCGHREDEDDDGRTHGFCCAAKQYAGRHIATIPGHEVRSEP